MTHREETWKKAYKRLLELYGENPDLNIVNRLLSLLRLQKVEEHYPAQFAEIHRSKCV